MTERIEIENVTLAALQERFGDQILETHCFRGDATAIVAKEAIMAVLEFLRTDSRLDYCMLTDETAVDYLNYPQARRARFEVVYHLYSLSKNCRVRIKVPVSASDVLPSATRLWKTADWLEREIWDMFGLRFEGHPNLKRILTHHEFVGHALRKDYPVKRRQPLSSNDTLMDEMEKRLVAKGLK